MEPGSNMEDDSKSLTILVYSDVVCPWCYIGKQRLEEGLALAGQKAEVIFLPYELNPSMPAEGMDRASYLDGKFGPGKRAAIEQRLDEAAEGSGLSFNWDKVTRAVNTRKAHILIGLATGQGVGYAVKGEIMQAYFTHGRDIGADEVLIELGMKHGLRREDIQAAFVDPAMRREIERLEDQAQQLGVQGVPFFIINNTYALSGAQPPEVWRDTLLKIAEKPVGEG